MQILESHPFPALIIELGEEGVPVEIKKAVTKTVCRKKTQQFVEAAKNSVGVKYGIELARLKLELMI